MFMSVLPVVWVQSANRFARRIAFFKRLSSQDAM
jgi:hypothetical protein